jgi:hypothetical protein
MNADKLADASRRGCTCVGSGLDRRYIATNNGRDKAGADLFVSDELHIGGLYHCVGGLDHRYKAFTLNHS